MTEQGPHEKKADTRSTLARGIESFGTVIHGNPLGGAVRHGNNFRGEHSMGRQGLRTDLADLLAEEEIAMLNADRPSQESPE